MSEHYAEEDQLEALKAWWKEYGNAVVVGVVAGAIMIGGYRYWNYYKTSQSEKASAIYEKILNDIADGKIESADKSAQNLINNYTISPYPVISSLMLANLYIEKKNTSKAKEYLTSAISISSDESMSHVATLRLSRILFSQENKPKEALALIENKEAGGFTSQYEELKGDINMSTGNVSDAVKNYNKALAGNNVSADYRSILQMKVDNAKSKLP